MDYIPEERWSDYGSGPIGRKEGRKEGWGWSRSDSGRELVQYT